MSDLKRTPSAQETPQYPAAKEVLRNRREFMAMAAKIVAVAAVPNFAAACMGAAEAEPVEPKADTVEDVEGEFPELLGDMPAPDTCTLQDVEDEFPPLAGEPIMPDTIQPQDVIHPQDVEGEFPPLAGDEPMPDTIDPADIIEAQDVEDEFPPLAGGIRMPDAVHGPDTE